MSCPLWFHTGCSFKQHRSCPGCYQSHDHLSMHPMYHPSPDHPFKPPLQYFGTHTVIHSIHRTLLTTPLVHRSLWITVFGLCISFCLLFYCNQPFPALMYSTLYLPRLNPFQGLVDPPIGSPPSAWIPTNKSAKSHPLPLPVSLCNECPSLTLELITLRFARVYVDRCLHTCAIIRPCTSNSAGDLTKPLFKNLETKMQP